MTLDELTGRASLSGDPMPQIRQHAQRIYTLAGGVQASPKKKAEEAVQGEVSLAEPGCHCFKQCLDPLVFRTALSSGTHACSPRSSDTA